MITPAAVARFRGLLSLRQDHLLLFTVRQHRFRTTLAAAWLLLTLRFVSKTLDKLQPTVRFRCNRCVLFIFLFVSSHLNNENGVPKGSVNFPSFEAVIKLFRALPFTFDTSAVMMAAKTAAEHTYHALNFIGSCELHLH